MLKIENDIYIGLLHYPIHNRKGDIITTTVTNLDLHDITRAGKTYDVKKYFVINHLKSQKALIKRMMKYWTDGYGAEFNENRKQAYSIMEVADNLQEVITEITYISGRKPKLVATDAKVFPNSISYKDMRKKMLDTKTPYLILFGTGWGLTEKTLELCDYILAPIYGRGEFNHLSVRSAASIILDRLLAAEWWQ